MLHSLFLIDVRKKGVVDFGQNFL